MFSAAHFAPAPVTTPAPATIVAPGPMGVPTSYETLGANGPTGTSPPSPRATQEDSELPEVPFTFDSEQRLLMKMNDQQGKTIEELMERIKVLEKALVEKPILPVCYVKCSHCYESD